MVLQKCLIRYILAPLEKVMGKLSEKTKDVLFVLSGLMIVIQNFMKNMTLAEYRFLIFFAIDCLFLGIMILCSLGSEMKPVKFRRPLSICWFGVGVMMLQSGIRNNVDYLPEAVLFLIVYPVMFICWNNADRTRIFKLLLRLSKLAITIFIVASFFFAKISRSRYPGIFNNTNGAAYFLAVAEVCLLVEIMTTKRFDWKCMFNILLLGVSAALLYYTNSRTGPLGLICALLFGFVLFILTHSWMDSAECFVRLIISAIVCAICISSVVYIFQYRQYLELPYFDSTSGQFYSVDKKDNSEKLQSGDKTESDKEEGNSSESKKGEFFDTSDFNKVTDKKSSTVDKTLDEYSTGRITIWKAFIKELNWTGHAEKTKIYIDYLYKDISSAHMTPIQIAYESGIPAGIFYFLMNMGTGLMSIWYAWKHREERYAIMPMMITLVFGVTGYLGSCGVSFWYMTTLYYYFAIFPLMAYLPKEEAPVQQPAGNN